MRYYVPKLIRRDPLRDCAYLSDRFIQVLPALYVAWVIPLLFTLVLLVPPWQHPDENAHFQRIAQIADGTLLGYRVESGAGGRVDPAIVAALLPFNAVPFHPDRKVTAAMYAAAHRFHWSMVRRDLDFRNTAFYPPFLYAPSVLAVWVGRALDLTIIQTLYLARGANAIVATFLTFLALVFARRTRIGLSVVAILPMTITLYTSASQDALIISLVILAVGAIDRIIDSDRAATGPETLLITLMLLLPAMARPPYAALSGLLLLTAPKNSLRAWISAAVIVCCMGSWWFSAAGSTVTIPPGDPSTQWASTIAHPTRLLVTAWSTLLSESKEVGVQLIGVLGWQDTRLPPSFIELAGTVLAFALVSSTTGPARRPWLAMLITVTGIAGVFLPIYFLFTSPEAAVVNGMQGRYFLPLVAVLALALPAIPWLGYKLIPVAAAGLVVLAIIEPAVVIRTINVRYYLSMG